MRGKGIWKGEQRGQGECAVRESGSTHVVQQHIYVFGLEYNTEALC